MHLHVGSFSGLVGIVTLVACGIWYARIPPAGEGAGCQWNSETGEQRPSSSVNRIAWSADGRALLSFSRGDVGPDGPLLLHDANGCLSLDSGGAEWVTSTELAPDGRHVLIGTLEGRLLWIGTDTSEVRCLVELFPNCGVTAVAVAPASDRVAGVGADGRIHVCYPRGEGPAVVLDGHATAVADACFSSDGNRLATAARDGRVTVWDLECSEREWESPPQDRPQAAVAFLPGENELISAGWQDTVQIWKIGASSAEWMGRFDPLSVGALALSPDGKTAAWAGCLRKIVVWDAVSRRAKFEIPTPISVVVHLRFSPDGMTLAAAGHDAFIRMYDSHNGDEKTGIRMENGL